MVPPAAQANVGRDDAEVVRCLEKVVALVAASPDDWVDRAKAYQRRNLWEQAADDYARGAEAGAVNPDLWTNKAEAHLRLGQRTEALAACDQAIRLNGRDFRPHVKRAGLFVESGEWDSALADLDTACQVSGEQITAWVDAARIRVNRSDLAGYRRMCEELIRRFGKTTDVAAANNACWACCLGPDALPDLAPAVRLAELAMVASVDHNHLNTLGAILYRTGRFKDAISRLREAIEKDGRDDLAQDWLFLAMAHHRLGDAKEARAALDKATAAMKSRPPRDASRPPSQQILEEMELEMLLREARSLLGGVPPAARDREPATEP